MIEHIQSAPAIWKYPSFQPSQKIAIFVPCYMDQFYPHAAQSMVEILERPSPERDGSEIDGIHAYFSGTDRREKNVCDSDR